MDDYLSCLKNIAPQVGLQETIQEVASELNVNVSAETPQGQTQQA